MAVVVRTDKNILNYTKYTLPIIDMFSKKHWGCDLIFLDHTPHVMTSDNKPHYRITKVYDILDKYDRVICMDADMLILPKCPNPLEIVPSNKIGSIFEDKGSRKKRRKELISSIQKKWGSVGWKSGYTNAGLFIVSKQHKDIFKSHNGKYWLSWGSADLHLAYNIHKYNFKIHELPYWWNHMTMFSEKWNDRADRFKSYIIHYAGKGTFNKKSKEEQIKSDAIHVFGKPRLDHLINSYWRS